METTTITHALASRRALLGGIAAGGTLLTLPACTSFGGFGLADAIQRLLYLSSERAFGRMLQSGGFWDQQVASLGLANILGTRGDVLGRILTSSLFKSRLDRAFGDIAYRGAERAAPIVTDAVRVIGIQNAIDLYAGLGLGTPKVAILSAVETVNPAIPSTIEAAALCKMADRGQITGGILDGPAPAGEGECGGEQQTEAGGHEQFGLPAEGTWSLRNERTRRGRGSSGGRNPARTVHWQQSGRPGSPDALSPDRYHTAPMDARPTVPGFLARGPR